MKIAWSGVNLKWQLNLTTLKVADTPVSQSMSGGRIVFDCPACRSLVTFVNGS